MPYDLIAKLFDGFKDSIADSYDSFSSIGDDSNIDSYFVNQLASLEQYLHERTGVSELSEAANIGEDHTINKSPDEDELPVVYKKITRYNFDEDGSPEELPSGPEDSKNESGSADASDPRQENRANRQDSHQSGPQQLERAESASNASAQKLLGPDSQDSVAAPKENNQKSRAWTAGDIYHEHVEGHRNEFQRSLKKLKEQLGAWGEEDDSWWRVAVGTAVETTLDVLDLAESVALDPLKVLTLGEGAGEYSVTGDLNSLGRDVEILVDVLPSGKSIKTGATAAKKAYKKGKQALRAQNGQKAFSTTRSRLHRSNASSRNVSKTGRSSKRRSSGNSRGTYIGKNGKRYFNNVAQPGMRGHVKLPHFGDRDPDFITTDVSFFNARLPYNKRGSVARDDSQFRDAMKALKQQWQDDPTFRERFTKSEQKSFLKAFGMRRKGVKSIRVKGFTWHHSTDAYGTGRGQGGGGVLQLLDYDLHKANPHYGGRYITGGPR